MFFRIAANITVFAVQGIAFAIETCLVMLGLLTLWNGFIAQKTNLAEITFSAALIVTLAFRFLVWLPVFARRNHLADVATEVDLGDRPLTLRREIPAIKPITPIKPAPDPPLKTETATP